MSESTPLLPARKKHDHPTFLRVCHSSHSFISQKTLLVLRSLIACYMLGAFIAKMYYDIEIVHHGWRTVFELSNLSWFLLTTYELVGCVWTYMHLYYPRLYNEPESLGKRIKLFLSPDRGRPSNTKLFSFCLFYNGATVLNPLVTFMHWVVILPHKKTSLNDMFGHDSYQTWVIINFFIVNTAISVFEVFFLSSIRCDQPIFLHIVWGAISALVLTSWLYLGHWVTGEYLYFFLDLGKYKWQDVVAMVVAFITLLEATFLFDHLIIVIRQSITRRQQDKRRRQRLPR